MGSQITWDLSPARTLEFLFFCYSPGHHHLSLLCLSTKQSTLSGGSTKSPLARRLRCCFYSPPKAVLTRANLMPPKKKNWAQLEIGSLPVVVRRYVTCSACHKLTYFYLPFHRQVTYSFVHYTVHTLLILARVLCYFVPCSHSSLPSLVHN